MDDSINPASPAEAADTNDTNDTLASAQEAVGGNKSAPKIKNPLSEIPYSAEGFGIFYNLMHYDKPEIRLSKHMVPVCKALTDDRISKLMIILGPGSGKSLLISISYIAYLLGCRPDYTVVGISAGEDLMKGFMKAIMAWIESSQAWQIMFPNVRPDKDLGWSTEAGMFVTGHRAGDPDASYIGVGLASKRLTGVHGRVILCDDLHDKENSNSEEACLRVKEAFYKQIMGRADPQGARYIMVGRRWHQADIYGHLKSTGEYVVMELPAMRKKDEMVVRDGKPYLYWDITIPDKRPDGSPYICCFNEHLYANKAEPVTASATTATPATA